MRRAVPRLRVSAAPSHLYARNGRNTMPKNDRPVRRFTHPVSGAQAVAVLPREIVNLQGRGFVEDKPQSTKKSEGS